MSGPHFTGPDVVDMLDSPAIISYPAGGGVQVDKAGILAIGQDLEDAKFDWCKKFSKMIAAPKVVTS